MRKDHKISKAQRSILEILRRSRGRHLRVEEIWDSLRSSGTDIHLSTVYRSLQVLTVSGQVKRNFLQENHAHYEITGTPGIHLVCSGCGLVREIGPADGSLVLGTLEKQLKGDFTVLDWQMQLTGRCSKCSAAEKFVRRHGR